jgi:hypothetical protein
MSFFKKLFSAKESKSVNTDLDSVERELDRQAAELNTSNYDGAPNPELIQLQVKLMYAGRNGLSQTSRIEIKQRMLEILKER